jgi:hypothetical protein
VSSHLVLLTIQHLIPVPASYLPTDVVARLDAYQRDALDCRKLREEFAEMGQTLLNLERRLMTDGLFLSDRLLRIWTHVKSTRADVSQQIKGMCGTLEADGLRYGVLHDQAKELEMFLDTARDAGGIGSPSVWEREESKERTLVGQTLSPAPHSVTSPTLASHSTDLATIPPPNHHHLRRRSPSSIVAVEGNNLKRPRIE